MIREATPPILYQLLRRAFKRSVTCYRPEWHRIDAGLLKGREIYLDDRRDSWQHAMLNGTYDAELFECAAKLNLQGRHVIEVGAHIGYHSMSFANLVGPEGKVFAFEPNPFNVERMRQILGRNSDLAGRISLLAIALSDHSGEAEFFVSPMVDSGMSSGSMLGSVHPSVTPQQFRSAGFNRITVRTATLDNLLALGIDAAPRAIKIDVEGAESSVLRGGINILRRHRPHLLIEVHAIKSMFEVCQNVAALDYVVTILKEEADGRCIVWGNPAAG